MEGKASMVFEKQEEINWKGIMIMAVITILWVM
jgi:hypothetical protein